MNKLFMSALLSLVLGATCLADSKTHVDATVASAVIDAVSEAGHKVASVTHSLSSKVQPQGVVSKTITAVQRAAEKSVNVVVRVTSAAQTELVKQTKNVQAWAQKNPKTVGLLAIAALVAGVATYVYYNPEVTEDIEDQVFGNK